MSRVPDLADRWAALDVEARAHGFPGVESYAAAYAAGYRPGGAAGPTEHIEAFASAADAASTPLAALVVRAGPEPDAPAPQVVTSEDLPPDEAWVSDADGAGLRPVSETRSLVIAGDRSAPPPPIRVETTLATTAATVAVVELNDGTPTSTPTHAPADHDFGTGAVPDDPAFGAGHPPLEGEALADPFSGQEPVDPLGPVSAADLEPGPVHEPVPDVAHEPVPDLVHEPVPDEPVHEPIHDEPAHDEPVHHEPAHHDAPADHGGEAFG